MKYQVGFLINNEMFETVIDAQNEAQAFCMARNKAEQYYFSCGANCVSMSSIDNENSYVKEYIEPTEVEMLEIFNSINL